MIAARFQPFDKFVLVAEGWVVSIVAIEEGDADDVLWNGVEFVQIAEGETAAAAVTSEHELGFGAKILADAINDFGNEFVAMLLAPGRPALEVALQINGDDGLVRKNLAEEA